jgi:hypothetical protein
MAGTDIPSKQDIARWLPAAPHGVGRPITDRQAWERLARHEDWQRVVPRAEGLLKAPLPEQPDDLYLDFSRTGNRTRWQRVAARRRRRIPAFTLAECIERKGRFLPALEETIAAVCQEKTWVYPAHDRSLANFKGERIDIDLASSAVGVEMATAAWLIGDALSETTRDLIRENLRRRIFDPALAMVAGKRKRNWWMRGTNNWNAVCWANVVGAALAQLDPRDERAAIVRGAVEGQTHFLRGFPPDGYCTEGVGYWNYGFGHYALLAEALVQATDDQLDLFAWDAARAPATYGHRIEIIHGVYPAFADCSVGSQPSERLMHFLSRRYRLGADPARDDERLVAPGRGLFASMIYSFPNSATKAPPAEEDLLQLGLRDWFDRAGILIARPPKGSACRLGAALKGGHNAEHHNHNDVGSFVIVLGDRPVLLDPGGEVYTARTFSSRRYVSDVLNSLGHPVPRVAGTLQRRGRKAQGRVVKTDFTDERDTLVLDIQSAYAVKALKSLQRTFVYSRQGAGSLTVTDAVSFDSPQEFETALITLGQWREMDDGSLLIADHDQAVRVELDAEAGDLEVAATTLEADVRTRRQPTRIAIRFTKPVRDASITTTITPAEVRGEQGLLPNGDFEQGAWFWRIPGEGFAAVSDEQAASGTRSLKITDAIDGRGSSVHSARVPAEAEASYELRGKVFPVSGEGVGMYVRFLDADWQGIDPPGSETHAASVGTLGGSSQRWEDFAFRFTTPPGTAYMQVWIHSYNAAQVVAYLDDLAIVPL